jgi:alkyl hydroperoxide reductase subunit F
MTAVVYAARKKLDTLVISGNVGGQTLLATGVETYMGYQFITGKTVIIASGRRARSLNVPGEKDLIGRGVSYCATCDAPLFDGMDVAVIGSGNPAITAVNDLTKYARKIRKGCGET